jgi:HTH-type transcriptional regulator/antitoxin MqsA
MQTVEHVETFNPPTGKTVQVRQLSARCDSCGKEGVLASQVHENLRLRAARKADYGEYLLGEDIFEFRRHWGLTQRDFSTVFGRGIIAFSRFETEKAYPDLTLTRLLKQAMRRPEVFKELADEAGVTVPLWEAHCQAERELSAARGPALLPSIQFLDLRAAVQNALTPLLNPQAPPKKRGAAKSVKSLKSA